MQAPCWHYPQPFAPATSFVQLHFEMVCGAYAEENLCSNDLVPDQTGSQRPFPIMGTAAGVARVGVKEEGSDCLSAAPVCTWWV